MGHGTILIIFVSVALHKQRQQIVLDLTVVATVKLAVAVGMILKNPVLPVRLIMRGTRPEVGVKGAVEPGRSKPESAVVAKPVLGSFKLIFAGCDVVLAKPF